MTFRHASVTIAVFLALMPTPSTAQVIEPRDVEELRKLPIATGDSIVAKLLRQWWSEGTAAGNVGDWYDNRDGEHSPLDLRPWPQLQKVQYTPEMLKARVNWAAQRRVLPVVVFGNSSTSAPAALGGSNPRQYYVSSSGLALLEQHYSKNNLYIYPEHRDHDPGRNGKGPANDEGFGDLYPTNTPYLIISQGSSGSDQPFMRAMPYVLAAFRPEVKAKLIETGMLMPTIQAIFRASNKHLKESDYLTGKAHPSVFEGAWVDPVKMVTMAHDLTLETVPPVVRLKVTEEDEPRHGIDYFDPLKNEKLGDTSAVIARVFRGKEYWRRMIVSAKESRDLNGKPIVFEWKLLRGDTDRVVITPKNESKSVVEIRVAHPERRPIAPGSPLESNRVDIGVFAKSGPHWSAPAFVTWYGIDNEARTYDVKGRVAEIAYGRGETRLVVKDWRKLLANPHVKAIGELTKEQDAAFAKLDAERAEFVAGKPDAKPDEKAIREFDDKQNRKLNELLGGAILPRLQKLVREKPPVDSEGDQATLIKTLTDRFRQLGHHAITGMGPDQPLVKGPTAFDRELDEALVAQRWRAALGDGIAVQHILNVVDPRVSFPRQWRDVYLYDAKGTFVGWTRYAGKEPSHFTADGHLITERDDLNRARKAKSVIYRFEPVQANQKQVVFRWSEGADEFEYEYAGDDDRRGVIKAEAKK